MASYPGVIISSANFRGLFKSAWQNAMNENNIEGGFESCGILPFNPAAVPAEAFLQNTMYFISELVANPELMDIQSVLGNGSDVQISVMNLPMNEVIFPDEVQSSAHSIENNVPITVNFADYLSSDPTVVEPVVALKLFQSVLSQQQIEIFSFVYSETQGTQDSNRDYLCRKALNDLSSTKSSTAPPQQSMALRALSPQPTQSVSLARRPEASLSPLIVHALPLLPTQSASLTPTFASLSQPAQSASLTSRPSASSPSPIILASPLIPTQSTSLIPTLTFLPQPVLFASSTSGSNASS